MHNILFKLYRRIPLNLGKSQIHLKKHLFCMEMEQYLFTRNWLFCNLPQWKKPKRNFIPCTSRNRTTEKFAKTFALRRVDLIHMFVLVKRSVQPNFGDSPCVLVFLNHFLLKRYTETDSFTDLPYLLNKLIITKWHIISPFLGFEFFEGQISFHPQKRFIPTHLKEISKMTESRGGFFSLHRLLGRKQKSEKICKKWKF